MNTYYQRLDLNNIKLFNDYASDKKSISKILVVDDVIYIQTIIKEYLGMLGINKDNIKTLSSGIECLELCKKENYDVIFMDINMAGLTGYETTAKLRDNGYKGLIIAITGMSGDNEYVKAYKSGMNYIHIKPLNIQVIKSILLSTKILT